MTNDQIIAKEAENPHHLDPDTPPSLAFAVKIKYADIYNRYRKVHGALRANSKGQGEGDDAHDAGLAAIEGSNESQGEVPLAHANTDIGGMGQDIYANGGPWSLEDIHGVSGIEQNGTMAQNTGDPGSATLLPPDTAEHAPSSAHLAPTALPDLSVNPNGTHTTDAMADHLSAIAPDHYFTVGAEAANDADTEDEEGQVDGTASAMPHDGAGVDNLDEQGRIIWDIPTTTGAQESIPGTAPHPSREQALQDPNTVEASRGNHVPYAHSHTSTIVGVGVGVGAAATHPPPPPAGERRPTKRARLHKDAMESDTDAVAKRQRVSDEGQEPTVEPDEAFSDMHNYFEDTAAADELQAIAEAIKEHWRETKQADT